MAETLRGGMIPLIYSGYIKNMLGKAMLAYFFFSLFYRFL